MATHDQMQMLLRSKPIRPARQQLLFQFDMQRDAEEKKTDLSYFIGTSYPPSVQPLSALSPVQISDLELETHHRGKVLILRCIDQALRSAALQTIVEDSNGVADRLAVYNLPLTYRTDDLLPEDLIFVVKEPYYAQVNQSCCIRVDHPSDLVPLWPSSNLLTKSFEISNSKTALQWKDSGNNAYGANNFLEALRGYTNAIDCMSDSDVADDVSLRRLVLRNRAIVQLHLGHFESALEDAKGAVIPKDERKDVADDKRNVTAYYRAGRAAYELHRYSEAESLIKDGLEISPQDSDLSKELNKITARRKDVEGEYDFATLSKSTNKKHNRLDAANFTSRTMIKSAGESKGRGLFAEQDVKAGELIMCEKAFSVSFDSDPGSPSHYAILDSKTQKNASGTTAALLFRLSDKLMYNLDAARKFLDLDDGGYTPRTPLAQVDDIVPVDTFRVLSIVNHNCLGCPTVRSSSNTAQEQLASSKGYPSAGLWLHASYINHACNSNAMRSFIGDIIIIRATRDIKQGEEICMPYRLPHPDNGVTQGELEKIWGFRCDCSLCRIEAATPSKDKKLRVELIDKVKAFLAQNKQKNGVKFDKKTIDQAERLYDRMEKTYDSKKFENMPRIGLVGLGSWLCLAYSGNEISAKIIQSALRVLRDLGFVVEIKGEDMRLTRDNCVLEPGAVDAAVHAAKAYKEHDIAVSKLIEGLARSLYQTLNGEMRGFEERHGL